MGRFFLGREVAERSLAARLIDQGNPALRPATVRLERHALISRPRSQWILFALIWCSVRSLVLLVLLGSGEAEIAAAIVQPIPIDVVNLTVRWGLEYVPVHHDGAPTGLSSRCVGAVEIPAIGGKGGVVLVVHERDLALRQRDFSQGYPHNKKAQPTLDGSDWTIGGLPHRWAATYAAGGLASFSYTYSSLNITGFVRWRYAACGGCRRLSDWMSPHVITRTSPQANRKVCIGVSGGNTQLEVRVSQETQTWSGMRRSRHLEQLQVTASGMDSGRFRGSSVTPPAGAGPSPHTRPPVPSPRPGRYPAP
jgi:hypothetical protein